MVEQLNRAQQPLRPWWIAVFVTVGIGLLVAFWLPSRFPPPLVDSDSYLFGFNNRLFLLLFLLVLTIVALLAKVGRLSYPPSHRVEELGPGKLSGKLIGGCIGVAGSFAAIYYELAWQVNGFVNTDYYLDRIHLLARGEVPFRDFEFIYGSAPLYVSLVLSRWLHISPDLGYYLLWGSATVIGVLLLGLSIRWLELPSGGKRVVFILTYLLFTIMISMVTLNYCALRYALPFFAITCLCRIDRDSRWITRVAVVCFAAAMTAALLGLSPEEGVVYAVAVCLYLPARRLSAQRPFVLDMLMLLVMIFGMSIVAAQAGTFITMQRLGSGGAWYLPIYPGPHILSALASVLVMVVFVGTGTIAERLRSNVVFATIYGVGMLPSALGRCDVLHVAGSLLPLLVCAMLLTWSWIPAWRVAVVAFLMSFIVLPIVINRVWGPSRSWYAIQYRLYHNGQPQERFDRMMNYMVTRLLLISLGQQQGTARIENMKRKFLVPVVDPHSLFPGASAVVATPFRYLPDGIHNYEASDIDEGYFDGLLNVLTVEDVTRKIDELRMHPDEDIVITKSDLTDSCKIRRGDRSLLRQLLQVPWVPQPTRESAMFVPYCAYIRGHYHFIYSTSNTTLHYGLMRRNPLSLPSSDSH